MPARNARIVCLAAAALVAAAAPAAASALRLTPVSPVRLTRLEASFLDAINGVRAQAHVKPVRVEDSLVRTARRHSAEMVSTGTFTHGDFLRRLTATGARGIVGEDLGWSADDGRSRARIVRMWLASPTHRAILLRPGFTWVGVGIVRGPFEGWRHAVVVTADFDGT